MLQLAFLVKDDFSDGVIYLDLRGLDRNIVDPVAAMRIVLSAITDTPDSDLQNQLTVSRAYAETLRGRSFLIVLDNASDAQHVRRLIPDSSRCAVLITSRQILATVANPADAMIRIETLTPEGARSLLGELVKDDRLKLEPESLDELIQMCGFPAAGANHCRRKVAQPSGLADQTLCSTAQR